MLQQTDRRLDLPHILQSARQKRRQLRDSDSQIDVVISGGTGDGGSTAIPCKFIVSGLSGSSTAQEIVKNLEKQHCNCVSSGEDEVTCTCAD